MWAWSFPENDRLIIYTRSGEPIVITAEPYDAPRRFKYQCPVSCTVTSSDTDTSDESVFITAEGDRIKVQVIHVRGQQRIGITAPKAIIFYRWKNYVKAVNRLEIEAIPGLALS